MIANVDSARLRDALVELAANARDALTEGGTITLVTRLLDKNAAA